MMKGRAMQSLEPTTASYRRYLNSVFLSEMIIGVILVVVFCLMFFQTREWPEQAALFPRLISIVGIVSTTAYLFQQIVKQSRHESIAANRILDVPWAKVTGDAAQIKRTAIGVIVSMAAFWLGIALIGFHASALIYLFSQLIIYGKMKAWLAALGAVIVVSGVVLIYDELAGTTWNDPILWDLARKLVGL